MGVATFIKNHFLNKEICISMGGDAETLTYEQTWAANHEYFRGIVSLVEDNVIVLDIPDNELFYICEDSIACFWAPGFNYYKAISTSITKRMVGGRNRS